MERVTTQLPGKWWKSAYATLPTQETSALLPRVPTQAYADCKISGQQPRQLHKEFPRIHNVGHSKKNDALWLADIPGEIFKKSGWPSEVRISTSFQGLMPPPPKGKNYVQTQQYQPCWQIPKWMDISSGISWPSCTKTFSFCQIYVNFPCDKRSGLWFWKNCTTSHCQHSIQLY